MINLPLPPPPSVHHLHVRAKRPKPRRRGHGASILLPALSMLILAAVAGAGWCLMKPAQSSDVHETLRVATDETLRLWRKGSSPPWDEVRIRPNEPVSWTIGKSSIQADVAWVPVELEGRTKQGMAYRNRYFLRWQQVRGEWRLEDALNKEAGPIVPPELEWMLR